LKIFTLSAIVWPQMSPSLCFRKNIRMFYSSPTCSATLIPLVMLEVQSWAFFLKLGPKSKARSTTYTPTLYLNFSLQLTFQLHIVQPNMMEKGVVNFAPNFVQVVGQSWAQVSITVKQPFHCSASLKYITALLFNDSTYHLFRWVLAL